MKEDKKKHVRNNEQQGQLRSGGRRCWRCQSGLIPLQPLEGPTPEQFVKDCVPWEGPMLEQGNSVRKKQQWRGAVRD